MIEWKKYDPKNPPTHWVNYLATDGKTVNSAYIDTDKINGTQWWNSVSDSMYCGVTHYAEINLPDLH